ncbi:hypothetical protein D3C81_1161370 [compost metagenome]
MPGEGTGIGRDGAWPVGVAGQVGVHLHHQVDQVTEHLQDIHSLRTNPCGLGDALACFLDLLDQVATYGQVEFLGHHLVEIPAGSQVEVVHRCQVAGAAGQQLESAEGLDLFGTAYRFGGMVIDGSAVALVLLDVGQAFHPPFGRLVSDRAVCLAGPAAVCLDALLCGLTVLPHLVPFGQAR